MPALTRRSLVAASLPLSLAMTGSQPRVGLAAPVAPQAPLPDFSGVRLVPGDWRAPWTPSDWTEPKLSGYRWSPQEATVVGGALELRLRDGRTAQVQAGDRAFSRDALFEVDATLPRMRPGLIVAPLWLYSRTTRDEADFEVVGTRGLTVTVYARGRSVWSRLLIPGDLSGARLRLGLRYQAGRRLSFLVDGRERAALSADDAEAFPRAPLKPLMELWPTRAVEWAGAWRAPSPGEALTLTIHGYRATPGGGS
ncbi:hypothetical protein [Brevundimonas sp.]|uniref:hypothetical protein n=1 Tax=Brevundimonas sp. TaxID=1871086 RepID=UPI0035AE061C